MTQPHLHDHESWYLRFHDLMPYRVREVLLVSSPYDAFILEEDGQLTERLFSAYFELNLSASPRITHAPTGARALELLRERRFDLVITMPRLSDMDLTEFASQVKEYDPMMTVALLAFTETELQRLSRGVDPLVIDLVFLWTGDSRMLLAIIKLTEDRLNSSHDTRKAGVQVIIVVEDSIQRYSSFLSLLYSEIMTQSQSLYSEGLNDLHRLMRMRARPKILLARNYEEAITYYQQFKDYLVALITDVSFPHEGRERPDAGIDLVRLMREDFPELPILIQSAEPENIAVAQELGALYVDKNAENFKRQIRGFLKESLGFGPFIFRLRDRTKVGQAEDVYEMERVLPDIPAESLEYHATHNHFSRWLNARSMFHLARFIRPRKISEFTSIESMREHLVGVLRQARIQEQDGVITDFSSRRIGPESQFVRVGSGSIGGKARGLAFANSLLARHNLLERFEGLRIRIPKTVVIGTDEFDRFFEENPQLEEAKHLEDDSEIIRRFLCAELSDDLVRDLEIACQDLRSPIAVRSSSLLEDSHLQPFAGIYATYMIPNNHPSPEERLRELCRAIKAVYASTYSQSARAYMKSTPYTVEEEKMGIVIQRLVGRSYFDRFYPHISGVGLSHNYYPMGNQTPEEGIVLMALGLGQIIVLGGSVLQFSPATPSVLPQFTAARDYLKYSQPHFYALDMRQSRVDFVAGTESSLVRHDLAAAEQDKTLHVVGSTYISDEDRIRDSLNLPGPRIVTFNNLLKWNVIPLAPALELLLRIIGQGMGCPVEIEFALNMGDWGQEPAFGQKRRLPCLNVVQVRPQIQQVLQNQITTEGYPDDKIFCHTDRALGHGTLETLRDIVYITNQKLDGTVTPAVAGQVGEINAMLKREGHPYLLIGPGRWGTSDPSLGIPVKWSQISGVRVMVETPFEDRAVDPSQGTHFFHNVTSFRIGYLTLTNKDMLDRAWLDGQSACTETEHVRHVQLERPLRIYLDGQNSKAVILKPAPSE